MDENDLQDIIDLTIEQRPSYFPVRPKVNYKYVTRNGRAYPGTKQITIPRWAGDIGESYLIYYTLHELCHFYGGWLGNHGPLFKKIEDEILSIWSLSIVRARAYPKALFANGQRQKCLKDKVI